MMKHFNDYKHVLLSRVYFALWCASIVDGSYGTTDFYTSTSFFYTLPDDDFQGLNKPVLPTALPEIIEASNALVELYRTNATYRDLMSNITDLCPGWLPCDVQPFDIEVGIECCVTCFCDEKCGNLRPCCPGFRSNNTESKSSAEFEDVRKTCVESAYFTENQKQLEAAPDFEMIADCPDGTPEFLRDKCVALFTEQEVGYIHAFVDIIPVTHIESQMNFANKHCAACHGLSPDDYQNWGVYVGCDTEILYDSETFEADVQLLDVCYLKVIPPTSKIANDSQCIKNMTSQCNITGLWEVYDKKIEKLCSDVDWSYRTPKLVEQAIGSILGGQRYKNIFCAVCNGDRYSVEGNTGSCPGTDLDDVTSAFTFLMNFDAAFQEPNQEMMSHNINRCPLGWMVDPLSNLCQEVVCSFPTILNRLAMACEERFGLVTFGSVEIPFQFELDLTQTFRVRGLPQFHKYFEQALESLRMGTDCIYHSIFYKTNTTYDALKDGSYISGLEDDVLSGIVIVYASLRIPFYRTFQSVLRDYIGLNVTVAGRVIELKYDMTEASYLPTATNSTLPDKTITLQELRRSTDHQIRRDSDIFGVYRDPFDGKAVLKVGESFNVDTCASDNLLYRKSYYDCPAFVYQMNIHGINYTATGIVLSRVNVELSLGEFRILNETHVAICLEKLAEKGLAVKNTLGVSGCADEIQSPVVFIFVFVIQSIIRLQ